MPNFWSPYHFKQIFSFYRKNIHLALALYKFQKNNVMLLLAKNTEIKLNNFRFQLSQYYCNQLNFLSKWKTIYFKCLCRSKKTLLRFRKNYRREFWLRRSDKYFNDWTNSEIKSDVAFDERLILQKIRFFKADFKKIRKNYHFVKKFQFNLITLGVVPYNEI